MPPPLEDIGQARCSTPVDRAARARDCALAKHLYDTALEMLQTAAELDPDLPPLTFSAAASREARAVRQSSS